MQQGFQFVLDHYLEAGKKVSVEDPSHKVLCVSLKRELASRFPISDWIIKGSTGQGYRTDYPWLAILNRKITASTMHGLYMVYLFRSDMRGFYLSLNQGITHFAEKYKNRRYDFAEKVADYFRKELPSSYFSRGEIDLNSRVKDLGYGYEKTNIISKYYPSHGFTENELITDLTAMREIYDFLYKHFPPSSNYDDIVEHVMRGFQNSGKVIEQDMIRASCELFRGNLWYINHYMAICDSMTKGYINDGILMEALRMMLSLHEPRFMRMMYSLTVYQINMLKAILDGVVKFSATEVIEKYGFNSSANVRRVKDALCKKEIVTFNERDEALVLDPLFEHWLRKYYFEIPELQQ